jgi:hypothetical protein
MRAFLFSEKVSKAGGLFEFFHLNRLPQSLAQLYQGCRIAPAIVRTLADVALGTVNPLEERFQTGAEYGVVVRAPQPAFRAKFHVFDAARRAHQSR